MEIRGVFKMKNRGIKFKNILSLSMLKGSYISIDLSPVSK